MGKVSCEEDPRFCPDEKTLKNFKTLSIWAEGVVGTINLTIQSISAVDCTGGSQASESSSTTTRSLYNINITAERITVSILGIVLAAIIYIFIRNYYLYKRKEQYGKIENDLHLEVEEV